MLSLTHILAIAFGGALGAVLRYGLQVSLLPTFKLPIAILLANIIGSFVMGLLFVLVEEKHLLPEWLKPLLMIGFLGAFTTFSSVSLDTVKLFETGQLGIAFANIVLNVLLTLGAAYSGIHIARLMS